MAINRKEVFRSDTFEQQRVKINETAKDLFDISTGVTPIDRLRVDQAIVPAAIEDSEGNVGEEGQFLKKTRDGKIIWKSLSIENVLWVSKDGDDTNDGLSQETAKASIGSALRAAQRGFNGKLCDAANNILLNKKLIQDEVVGTLLSENKDYARGNRWIDAYDDIIANKDFIAAEAVARGLVDILAVDPLFTIPNGDQECIDDVKLFVDAVAFNVKYDGNNRVYDFAEYYINFTTTIDGERDESQIIYQKAAYLMMEVMRHDPNIVIVGTHGLTPVFKQGVILDPLAVENSKAWDAALLIDKNLELIAAEAYARMAADLSHTPPAGTTEADCIDDIKDVIEVIKYNMLYGGNDKTYDAANVYSTSIFEGVNVGDIIDDERDETKYAFLEAQYLIWDIIGQRDISAEIVGTHGFTQYISDKIILDPLALIGNNEADAYRTIEANKDFIAAEAYDRMLVDFPGFAPVGAGTTPQDCIDDVKDILSAIQYNLVYGGNDRVYDAANVYVTGEFPPGTPVTTLQDEEREEAAKVFEYASLVAIDVMRNIAVTPVSGTNNTFTQAINPDIQPDLANPDCAVVASTIDSLMQIVIGAVWDGIDELNGAGSIAVPRTEPTPAVAYGEGCSDIGFTIANLFELVLLGVGDDTSGAGDITGITRTTPPVATEYGKGCYDVASAIWSLSEIYFQAIGTDAGGVGNLDGITRTSNNRFVFPDSPAESGRWKDARNLIYANMDEIQDRALSEIALEYPDFYFPNDDQTNRFSRYKDSHRLIQQNRREIVDTSLAEIALTSETAADGTNFSYPGDPVETPQSRYKDAYRLVQKNRTTIINLAYDDMAVSPPGPVGNPNKCKRDLGYFVDAISLDMFLGSAVRYTREYLLQYYDSNNEFKLNGLEGEEQATIICFNNIEAIMEAAISNQTSATLTNGTYTLTTEATSYGETWYQDLNIKVGNPTYNAGNEAGDTATNTDVNSCADVRSTVNTLITLARDVLSAEIASRDSGFAVIPEVDNVPQGKYQDASNLVFANKNEIADRALAAIAIANPNFVFPGDPASNVENYRYYDGYRLIIGNFGDIQNETYANTASEITNNPTEYPEFHAGAGVAANLAAIETKCRRDIGYFVNAVALDIFTRGNRYSREFALKYFDEYGVRLAELSDEEQKASVFAWNFAGNLMRLSVSNQYLFTDPSVVVGPTVFGGSGGDVTNTDPTACSDVQSAVDSLVTMIVDVFENDDVDLLPYLNNGQYNAGAGKCKRDIGYLVDAVSSDLYNEANIKSVQNALAYFPGGVYNDIGEEAESVVAFQEAADQMELAVTNNLFKQDLTILNDGGVNNQDPTNCADVRATIQTLVSLTKDAINTAITDPVEAYNTLNATPLNYGNPVANESKCGRDIGYFVDAISLDIFLGAGNTYSRKLAQNYFITPDVPIYPGLIGEESQSVTGFNKARDMMQKAVTNQLYVKDLTISAGPATFAEKIIGLDRVSNVATVTTSIDHDLETNDVVSIVGTGTAFDAADRTIIVTGVNTFTYTNAGTNESLSGSNLGTVIRPVLESGNEDSCVDVQSSIASLTAIITDSITAGNLNSLPVETKFREDRFDDAANLIGLNKNEILDRSLAQIAIEHPDYVFQGDDTSTLNSRFFDSYRLIINNKALITDDAFDAAAANPLYADFFTALTSTQIDKCKRDTGYFIDAVSLDVFTQGNRYIRYNTEYYFDADGKFIPNIFHPSGATEESLFVFRCAAELMKASITNQDSFTFTEDLAGGAAYLTADLSGYYKDLTLTPDPVTKSNIDPLSCANVRTLIDNLTAIKVDEITAGAADVNYTLNLPGLDEGVFLDTDSLLTPGGKTCRRDIGFIVDAVMADLKGRKNTSSIEAAVSYLTEAGDALIDVIAAEVPQTLTAFNKAAVVMKDAIQNVLYKRDLTVTDDGQVYPNKCQDVQTEIDALVAIVTTTLSDGNNTNLPSVSAGSPGVNEVKCRRDIGYVARAIAEDLYCGGNIHTITVARAYFDTEGTFLPNGLFEEEVQSIVAFKAAAKWAKKALTNQLYTKDLELFRGPEEYGLNFVARDYTKSGSDKVCVDVQYAVDNLSAILEKVLTDKSLAYLDTVKENRGRTGWKKTESLCFRDTGYIVVGIATDLKVGGNVNTTDIANFYFDNKTGKLIYIDGELEQSILAYRTARDIMKKAANQWIVSASNDLYEPKYSFEPLYTDPEVIPDFDYPYCQDVLSSIDNYWNIIEDMLIYDGPFSVPAQLPSFKTTVFVKSGVYTEQTPITLPPNTGIFGDNLRDVSIYPDDPTKNLIYCENGGYITNVTFSGHLAPSYTCSFPKVKIGDNFTKTGSGVKGSYEITLNNTQGIKERMYVLGNGVATAAVVQKIQDKVITLSTANGADFTDQELTFEYYIGTAGNITRSPYVQNCTSLTTTGSGLIVDGNLAEGTASFVLDSYTQYNQGGDGIVIVNGGYTQLVSIFEICCDRAVYLTAGSTCSITNSNTDFGNFGLVADGVGPLQYTCKVDGTQAPGAEFNLKDLPREPYVGQGITIGNNGKPYYFVQTINITDGGTGYTSSPSVVIDSPTGPSGIPAQAIATVENGSVTEITIVSSGSQFIDPPNVQLIGGGGVGAVAVPEMYPQYYSILTSTDVVDGKATITTDENIAFTLNDGDEVYFFQLTKIIANSHCMEYVGAGTKIQEAIPARGGVPIQTREVVELNGGKVAFTSTDHLGNFRIGQGLQINQNTGTLSGDSFQRSLFVTVTPFILALS